VETVIGQEKWIGGSTVSTSNIRSAFLNWLKKRDMADDQSCVKRRAILSILSNPSCKSEEMANKVVNEVWESCFKDTRPFDEVRASGRATL
jgi:inner membrane protease ATP23